MAYTPNASERLLDDIRSSIIKVLSSDSRPMPLSMLSHKVYQDLKDQYPDTFIRQGDLMTALDVLIKKFYVGKNIYNKYFIDYLDYEEKDVSGEGFLEVDPLSGNGYITVKKNFREYKKSSHFVHKKNINGAQTGDYVKFVELNITNKTELKKHPLIDASIKEILPKP